MTLEELKAEAKARRLPAIKRLTDEIVKADAALAAKQAERDKLQAELDAIDAVKAEAAAQMMG